MTGVPADFRRDWHRLWRVAEQVAATTGGEPGSVFGYVGLFLDRPDVPDRFGGYINSPLNTATFASTGCDGAHFGVLYTDDDVSAAAPVVMTVPMQFDDPNHLVGASLPEFLALGYVVGFQCLEQLAYDQSRGEFLDDLQAQRTQLEPEHRILLRAVVAEFDLEPWPDVAGRLRDLAAQYGGALILDYAQDEPLEDGHRVHEILMARQAAYDAAFRARQQSP